MNLSNTSILSGKYQVLRSLGSGNNNTVYLVRHQFLELERAIKVFPRTESDQLSILSEARLLKSLHHPGIPIIYDIEYDDNYYYLVEEYIQGDSLEEFLLHQKTIFPYLFFTFCNQLCEIFIYMHTALSFPVLYQDLKPEHIILCAGQIKLVDFGLSTNIANGENVIKRFGNLDFSAPENFTTQTLTLAADVYSLGKLMQYLQNYVAESLPKSVNPILFKATAADPSLRYETVEELQSALSKEFFKLRQPHLCKKIAVVGNHPGSGVTHVAISLVSALNATGRPALYIENNDSNHIRSLLEVLPNIWEKDGCIYFQFFRGYPKYGPGISLVMPKDNICITDYGTDLVSATNALPDLLLYVVSDAPWYYKNALDKDDFFYTHKDTLRIICNPGQIHAASYYAKSLHLPIYPYFYDTDAFLITKEKIKFTDSLLKTKGRFFPFFLIPFSIKRKITFLKHRR